MKQNKLDTFLDQLEADILNEAYQAHGPKGYERWLHPKFQHCIPIPDGHASLTGECGDTMEIFLAMDGEVVADAAYRTTGCASSAICGSFAAELAIGKQATEILDMTGETILREIGRFPQNEEHCAHLAVTTLQEAINKYMRETATGRNTTPK